MSQSAGGGGLHPELKGFLFVLLVIFLAWLFLGGKENAKNTQQPFLYPAAPIGSGEEHGVIKKGETSPIIHPW